MKHVIITACLTACIAATGCASRPEPMDLTLRVESTKPGVQYHLSGTVDCDGKVTTVDQQTPYKFDAKGLVTNASLTSHDADCHLLAGYTTTNDRELLNQAVGAAGCQVVLITVVKERTSKTQIDVTPLTVAQPAAVVPEAAAPAPVTPAPVAPTPAAPATVAPAATP